MYHIFHSCFLNPVQPPIPSLSGISTLCPLILSCIQPSLHTHRIHSTVAYLPIYFLWRQLSENALVIIINLAFFLCISIRTCTETNVLHDFFRIGGASSWRGSGFLGGVKLTHPEMKILCKSKALAQELSDAGHDTGWKQCGGLHLARSRDRITHFRKMKAIAEWVSMNFIFTLSYSIDKDLQIYRFQLYLGHAYLFMESINN